MSQQSGEAQEKVINVNVNQDSGTSYTTVSSEKSRKTALILCLVLGMIGGHHFYVGRITKGLIYLFTGGLFMIGVIMDAIALCSGSFKDNAGAPLRQW